MESLTAAALKLIPLHNAQFSDMLDDAVNTTTMDADNASWAGAVTALPVEECERLRGDNATLWLLLNLQSNATTGGGVRCLEHAPELTNASAVRAAVLAAMAALSLFGNLATIASIRRSRADKRACHHSWNNVYALIMHLSVADLFVTIFCIVGEAAWSYTVAWIAGNVACKVFKFLQMFSLYLSTFVLVLIGVDRFVVVRYPMKSLGTAKRLSKLVVFVWILSLVLSIPQLVIFHVGKGPFYEEFYQCVTYGFYTQKWQEQLYTTFSLVCMFILPLVILIATYVSTIITISRSEKMFQAEVATGGKYVASDVNRRRLIHRAKMKSLRISVVIVVAFILWWTPYYTMMIIFMFLNPDKHLSEDLQSGIFFFGMSNSLVNPIIYGAFHLWRPRKERMGSNSDYKHSLHRRSTMSNATMVDPRGSTRVVNTKERDEETSLVSLDEVNTNHRRLSTKFIQRYKTVITAGTNGKTHI